MPEEYDNISKHNHEEKSMKVPFTTHADIASLLEKVDNCHKNPSTTKIYKYTKVINY